MLEDKLQEKIKKIFALIEGADNQNEAINATVALQNLLLNHELTMSEVAHIKNGAMDCKQNVVDDSIGDKRATFENHKYHLLNIIAKNFRCLTYYDQRSWGTRKQFQFMIVGGENDVKLVTDVYNKTCAVIKSLWKPYQKEQKIILENMYYVDDALWARYRRSLEKGYWFGFAEAMELQFDVNKKKLSTTALARLEMPQEVKEHVAGLGLKTSKTRASTISKEGYDKGYDDGLSYNNGNSLV